MCVDGSEHFFDAGVDVLVLLPKELPGRGELVRGWCGCVKRGDLQKLSLIWATFMMHVCPSDN